MVTSSKGIQTCMHDAGFSFQVSHSILVLKFAVHISLWVSRQVESSTLVFLAFTEDRLRRFLRLALSGDVSSDELFGPQKVRRDLKQANQELNTVSRAGTLRCWSWTQHPLLETCVACPWMASSPPCELWSSSYSLKGVVLYGASCAAHKQKNWTGGWKRCSNR